MVFNRNPKLTAKDRKIIQDFEDYLKELNINYDEERYRLLEDWVIALKQELYFASFSIMRIFIEKGLRDLLIISKLKEKWIIDNIWEEHQKIEQEIEDGLKRDLFLRWYSFDTICDKLTKKYKILKSDDSEWLKELYHQYRIPIQHWIYWRFINYVISNDHAKEENVEASIRNATKIEWKINWIDNRNQVLPQAMKIWSIVMLKKLPEIIQLIEPTLNIYNLI